MDTYGQLQERIAVVTGAGSGMGAAVARLLVASGARVALVGRRADALHGVADPLGAAAIAVPTDLQDETSVGALRDTVHDSFGQVDLIVNAAGVMLPNPIGALRSDEWDAMIGTNLEGPLRMIAAFAPDLLAAAEAGRAADLVSISSVAAHNPIPEYAVYNATKAAVSQLAASLVREWGPRGIRVSNIEPGLTRTPLGAAIDNARQSASLAALLADGQSLEPEDVAQLVGFMVSRPSHVDISSAVIVPTARG